MTLPAKPLPTYLTRRFKGWHATQYQENRAWFGRLASEGQRPRAMVISCCDSRVHLSSMFGADTGEFFIHRNIANLIPPYKLDEEMHGTSAAIEYAVLHLKIANLLVVGHSGCGGVEGCHDMCDDPGHPLGQGESFIGPWLEILRPGYDRVKDAFADRSERLTAMEKEGVVVSLENLMTFPFVADAVASDQLTIHGLWNDIGTGSLECYDASDGKFHPI